MTIGAKHVQDLLFGESAEEPGDCFFIAVLQNTLDCVDRVGRRVKVFNVRIPEQET